MSSQTHDGRLEYIDRQELRSLQVCNPFISACHGSCDGVHSGRIFHTVRLTRDWFCFGPIGAAIAGPSLHAMHAAVSEPAGHPHDCLRQTQVLLTAWGAVPGPGRTLETE